MIARYKSIFRNNMLIGLVFLVLITLVITQGCKSQEVEKGPVKTIDAVPLKQNEPAGRENSSLIQNTTPAASQSPADGQNLSQENDESQVNDTQAAAEETAVLSADLSELGDFAGGMDFIVGNKASAIDIITINNIKNSLSNKGINTGRVILTSELSDYKDKRYFVIGSPCENPVAAELFKKEIAQKGDCHIFASTAGIIRLIPTKDNNFVMYIGANMAENTRKAGVVVQDYDNYGLTGTDVHVLGTLSNPQMVVVK